MEFTCVGVEVSFLEWRINEMRIDIITGNSNEGAVLQHGPFTLFLDSITRRGGRANMTSRLIASISNLIIGNTIRCTELGDLEHTRILNYSVKGMILCILITDIGGGSRGMCPPPKRLIIVDPWIVLYNVHV